MVRALELLPTRPEVVLVRASNSSLSSKEILLSKSLLFPGNLRFLFFVARLDSKMTEVSPPSPPLARVVPSLFVVPLLVVCLCTVPRLLISLVMFVFRMLISRIYCDDPMAEKVPRLTHPLQAN